MRLSPRILFVFILLAGAEMLRAQQTSPSTPPPSPSETQGAKPISPSTPPPPPPPETPADKQIDPSTPPPPPPEDTPATPAADSGKPVFDPYHAQKSLDVGTFYMKTGRYDAAIDRFQEAARYQPSLAAPWKLLGESYEKQHAYAMAIDSYKKYLELFPRAPDAEKITKQISALQEKVDKESAKEPTR